MKVGQKVFTDVAESSTPTTAATENAQAGRLSATESRPLVCSPDDDAPISTAADSPTARSLREQQAATPGVRQTGAEGTGQGDGPSGRPELTAAQAAEQRKAAKEQAETVLGAGGSLLGGAFGGEVGAVIVGALAKLFGKEADNIKLPTAQEAGGTAGASSSNPLDRAWKE